MAEKLTIDQQHADMGKSVPLIETRLFDLVRYARNYLFDEQLITLGEWTWLLTAPEGPHSPSARRLESYDELRATIAEQAATIARLERELAQRREDFRIQNSEIVRCHDERDTLTARVRRLQARVDALFSAASLGRAALGRHDRWCGHSRNAPGDAIIHQAERALTEALDPSRCLDCGTLDYIDGRAHYEDGIRCMACATVAALKEQP